MISNGEARQTKPGLNFNYPDKICLNSSFYPFRRFVSEDQICWLYFNLNHGAATFGKPPVAKLLLDYRQCTSTEQSYMTFVFHQAFLIPLRSLSPPALDWYMGPTMGFLKKPHLAQSVCYTSDMMQSEWLCNVFQNLSLYDHYINSDTLEIDFSDVATTTNSVSFRFECCCWRSQLIELCFTSIVSIHCTYLQVMTRWFPVEVSVIQWCRNES